MAAGYLQDSNGNKSSSRLIGFIVILWALSLATTVVVLGYIEGSKVMITSAAAGTIFTTIAGPVMYFLFNQKKQEII